MLLREAKIEGEVEWISFERGLSFCDTAKRQAQWYLENNPDEKLPITLNIHVRDVGSKISFLHKVQIKKTIEVTPIRNDIDDYVSPVLCVICRKDLECGWEYAACQKCADEFDYDFSEDDRNFDAANGR
jgi:hypothetical protein